MSHARDNLLPTMFVVMVTENLLIGMAEIAVLRQQLLVLARTRKAGGPFGSGDLGLDLTRRRQQLQFGDARELNVVHRGRAVDRDLLLHEGLILTGKRDTEGVGAGFQFGEFVAAVLIAVDRGAD